MPDLLFQRVAQWWQRRQQGPQPAAATWDPMIPVEAQKPEAGLERAKLAERLMLLATMCRASFGGFTSAAQHTSDSELADWLHGCARQRKALASELRGIVMVLADETTSPPWQRWVAQVGIERPGGWGESWLSRCVRGEENLMRQYEQLLSTHLPNGIATLLRRQYEQVVTTAEALRRQLQAAG